MTSDFKLRQCIAKCLRPLHGAKRGDQQYNRFTHGYYLLGIDSLECQIEQALIRLRAVVLFGKKGPGGWRLPMNFAEREELKLSGNPVAILLSLFARSLDANGFDLNKHPSFEQYAGGFLFLDTPYRKLLVSLDSTILERYPPRPLPGLSTDSYWGVSLCPPNNLNFNDLADAYLGWPLAGSL